MIKEQLGEWSCSDESVGCHNSEEATWMKDQPITALKGQSHTVLESLLSLWGLKTHQDWWRAKLTDNPLLHFFTVSVQTHF